MRSIIKALLFAACFALVLWSAITGMALEDAAAQVAGTSGQPYAYRVLTPGVIWLLVKSGLAFQYALVYVLAASLAGFILALRWLAAGLGRPLGLGALSLALLGLLPLTIPLTQVYDYPTLALFTFCLAAVAHKRKALCLALFVAACLNRETTFLLIIIYVVYAGWDRLALWQVGVYVVIRVAITVAMMSRPGGIFEIHIFDHWSYYGANVGATVLYLFVFGGALYLATRNWPAQPRLLKVAALVTVAIIAPAYFIIGFPFEFRVFYEAYPAIYLLALNNIRPLSSSHASVPVV